MWLCRNAEVKSEPDRQIHQKYVCGKGIWFYMPRSLTTKVTREPHIGTKCTGTRCSVKRIAAFQRHAYGGETVKIVKCPFLVFCVLKSTLTHACYKIIQYAFLISRTSNWYNSYESDSNRVCTCTHTLQRISLPHFWFPRTSEAEGLFQGSLLVLHGKISALDPLIHVVLLISTTYRLFFSWSITICMTGPNRSQNVGMIYWSFSLFMA